MCERLIKIPEAADRLAVSADRVRELARDGVIPAVKLGRSWRVREQQLDAFIAGGSRVNGASTVQ